MTRRPMNLDGMVVLVGIEVYPSFQARITGILVTGVAKVNGAEGCDSTDVIRCRRRS